MEGEKGTVTGIEARLEIAPQGLTPDFIARAVQTSHDMDTWFGRPEDPRLEGLQAAVDSGDPQVIRDLVEATGVCFKGVFLAHAAALRKKAHPDRTKPLSAA